MSRWRGPAALVAALALGVTACGGSVPPPAAPSPAASPSPSPSPLPVVLPGADETGAAQLSVRSSGIDRPYLLAPARRTPPGTAPALLVLLPAANTLLREEYDRYGIDAFRDRGFTVLVAGHDAASWNAGACCGRPAEQQLDDVAAVTAMRKEAVRLSGADASRTAVLGHSVGAFMAWRLACTPGFGATSVVAVSGALLVDCPTLPRTPHLLSLNGELDTTVPVDGAEEVVAILGIAPPSVRASAEAVAAAGSCGPATATAPGTTDFPGCSGGGQVRLQLVAGEGHPWEDLDATRRAAEWFATTVPGVLG